MDVYNFLYYCSFIKLFCIFYGKDDMDLKLKFEFLEGILWMIWVNVRLDCFLLFLYWNEIVICDIVEELMKEIGSLFSGEVEGNFYLMFVIFNVLLVCFFIDKGVYID